MLPSAASSISRACSAAADLSANVSNIFCFSSSKSIILSSIVSSQSSLCTSTFLACPILYALDIAWFSVDGLSCGSHRITTLADCMFNPVPPAIICAIITLPAGALSRLSIISCLLAESIAPVITPTHSFSNSLAIFSIVSKKNENIIIFLSSSFACSTSSSNLVALDDCYLSILKPIENELKELGINDIITVSAVDSMTVDGKIDYSQMWCNVVLSYLKAMLKRETGTFQFATWTKMYKKSTPATKKKIKAELWCSLKRKLS